MEYKSETEELWLLQHPAWVRWLAWVGVPFLLMGCGYVLLLPVIEDNYHVLLIGSSLLLGGWPIYKCMHALKIFPYLRSDIEFGPGGFSVYWPNGNHKSYTWLDVSSLTRYPIVGIVELKDSEDRCILAMDEHVTSFEKFSEFLVRKSGLSV